MHQELYATGPSAEAPFGAHWRKTSPVRHLQETFQFDFQLENAFTTAFWTETLRL